MIKLQATHIFPISSPPISNGIVILSDKGVIADVIDPLECAYEISDLKYFEGIICPGFVNSHCHLELSNMIGLVEEEIGLHNFILKLQQLKKTNTETIEQAIFYQDKQMYNSGIVACADIVNTCNTIDAKAQSKIYYHNFIELFGSDPSNANHIFEKGMDIYKTFNKKFKNTQIAVTPHSFYAVSEKLLKVIADFSKNKNQQLSIHHLESLEENDFFLYNSGTIPERLKLLGVNSNSFNHQGKSSLQTLGKLLPNEENIQLVHNTYTEIEDIEYALNIYKNIWWCLCPTSNRYIENHLPDIVAFLNKKLCLTIGTDSLASNTALSILKELKILQEKFKISTLELLKFSTLNGADFLNINGFLGSIEKNKKPGLVHINNINPENLFFTQKSESFLIMEP